MQDARPPLPPLGHQEKHPGVVADGEEKKKGGGSSFPIQWHLTRRENQKASSCETLTSLMLPDTPAADTQGREIKGDLSVVYHK